MNKPKNRVMFSRRSAQPSEPQEPNGEIPRGSKQEIRHLIEVVGATSTTKIAETLNEQGYPPANAKEWTAAMVDSALRRQDMDDLKERLKENRGDPEDSGISALEIRQAAYDGAKDAMKNGAEVAPAQIDTHALKDFVKQIAEANEKAATVITGRVQTALNRLLTDTDLASVRRVTDKTGENVGKVLTKIDDTCVDLHDTVVETLQEHSKTVVDACENMGATLYERLDQRFDALEDKLVEKFTAGVDFDLDESLGRVVDARLKHHLDTVVNQFASMVDSLRRELAEEKFRRRR